MSYAVWLSVLSLGIQDFPMDNINNSPDFQVLVRR